MAANPLDLAAWSRRFFDSVIAMRVEEIADAYAARDDVLVFLEGPRWQTVGHERIARGWRAFGRSPMRVRSIEWLDGPHGRVGSDLAWLGGTIELRFGVGDDPEVRSITFRATHVLMRETDGRWRIVHEHVSQPLADPYGFGDWLPEADAVEGLRQ
jgi:ketosteroid isomerase-like protein